MGDKNAKTRQIATKYDKPGLGSALPAVLKQTPIIANKI